MFTPGGQHRFAADLSLLMAFVSKSCSYCKPPYLGWLSRDAGEPETGGEVFQLPLLSWTGKGTLLQISPEADPPFPLCPSHPPLILGPSIQSDHCQTSI